MGIRNTNPRVHCIDMKKLPPRQLGQIVIDLVAAGTTHEQLGRVISSLAAQHPSLDDKTYGLVLMEIASADMSADTVGSFVIIQGMRKKGPAANPVEPGKPDKKQKRKFTVKGRSSFYLDEELHQQFVKELGPKRFHDLGTSILDQEAPAGSNRSSMMERAMAEELAVLGVQRLPRY